MAVLIILVLSCLIFRGLGFAGISAFATWQACARDGLSLMLLFTGISHFTFMKEDFVRMMPPSIPLPRRMVYFTGVCEIAGAGGLLLPEFRRAAAPPKPKGTKPDTAGLYAWRLFRAEVRRCLCE